MFTPEFLLSIPRNSPEELFVDAARSLIRVYRTSDVFHRYNHAGFEDLLARQNDPLYVIDGELSYGPQPSDEVVSFLWKERLLSYGDMGAVAVQAIGDLKTSTDLLVGKSMDFCMPYKRELSPVSGFINGNHIDYASSIGTDPSLFIQIGPRQVNGQGMHFPILNICSITIR